MKRYIEINNDNEIIDLFCDYQVSKMSSSTKIFFDEVDKTDHRINGLSISEETGVFIFKWDGSNVTMKSDANIKLDPIYIKAKQDDIKEQLRTSDSDAIRIIDDIIEHIENGTPIPQNAKDKIQNRKTLRGQL